MMMYGRSAGTLYLFAGTMAIIAGLSFYIHILSLRLDVCDANYRAFTIRAETLGERAKQDALIKDNANERNRRIADEKFIQITAASAAVIKRLRRTADTRSRILPEAPANSKSPDLYCADRAQFERGRRKNLERLRERIRAVADRCTANTVKYESLCGWVRGVK